MGIFGTREKSPLYHAANGNEWSIPYSSIEELQRWADDPNCIEREGCAKILRQKMAAAEAERAEREQRLTAKRSELQENPFDPRTEISADARHVADRVVKNLWIIFVLLPIVTVLLIQLFRQL